MSELERAENALRDAERAVIRLESEQSKAGDAARAKARAEYDDRIRIARMVRLEAKTARDTAAVALAAGASGRAVPVGARVEEWRKKEVGGWRKEWTNQLVATGRRGIVEVFTPQSEYPDNRGAWRRPRIGDFVIRLLKKDGSPSKDVISLHDTDCLPRNQYGACEEWRLSE